MNNITHYSKDGKLYVEKQIEGGKIVTACEGNWSYCFSVALQQSIQLIERKEVELKQQKKA